MELVLYRFSISIVRWIALFKLYRFQNIDFQNRLRNKKTCPGFRFFWKPQPSMTKLELTYWLMYIYVCTCRDPTHRGTMIFFDCFSLNVKLAIILPKLLNLNCRLA